MWMNQMNKFLDLIYALVVPIYTDDDHDYSSVFVLEEYSCAAADMFSFHFSWIQIENRYE